MQGVVAVLDVGELLLQTVAKGYQSAYGVGLVLLLQVVDEVEPCVDLVKLCRVKLHVLHAVAHLLGNVLQFYIGGVHTLGQFPGQREYVADAFQGVHGGA